MKKKKANIIRSILLKKINNEIISIIKRNGKMRINGKTQEDIYKTYSGNYEIELRDDGNININDSIVKFISFIKEISEDKKNKILIHCSEGISRAPCLVCAYLMWKFNMDSDSAINFVKEKRKCVDINFGFLFQLRNFQLNKEFVKGI